MTRESLFACQFETLTNEVFNVVRKFGITLEQVKQEINSVLGISDLDDDFIDEFIDEFAGFRERVLAHTEKWVISLQSKV